MAFFVVNFGFSKDEYYDLTPVEKALIYKAWEDKVVLDTTMQYKAMATAIRNTINLSKRRRPPVKLWTKKQKKADLKRVEEDIRIVNEITNNNKDWIKKIYQEVRS